MRTLFFLICFQTSCLPAGLSCQGAVGVRGPVRGCPLGAEVSDRCAEQPHLCLVSPQGRVYTSEASFTMGVGGRVRTQCGLANFFSEQLAFSNSTACLSQSLAHRKA